MSYVVVLLLKDYTSIGYTSLESSVKPVDYDFSKVKCILSFGVIGMFITSLLYSKLFLLANVTISSENLFDFLHILSVFQTLQDELGNQGKCGLKI